MSGRVGSWLSQARTCLQMDLARQQNLVAIAERAIALHESRIAGHRADLDVARSECIRIRGALEEVSRRGHPKFLSRFERASNVGVRV